MNRVTVYSLGIENEIEWKEVFEAKTISAAKAKATRWINRNLFSGDYSYISKDESTKKRHIWWIH